MPKKPCPQCGESMDVASAMCRACYAQVQKTPEYRAAVQARMLGKPSYVRTPESRAKMSKAKMGNTAFLGHKHTVETRSKQRAAWTPAMREAARVRGLLAAENLDWLRKIAEALSGEKNPNYKGHDKATPYGPGWGRMFKDKMRARSEGRCDVCGKRYDRTPDLHHKDFSKTNHHPDNLMVVCRKCHKGLHAANSRRTKARSSSVKSSRSTISVGSPLQ